MSYWLIKSEPEEYSYDMLVRDGKAVWTGVRGFQAMKNLRSMKPGDTAFYYHTGEEKAIVGICRILTDHFADPTSDDDGPWVALEIAPVSKVNRPVTLAEVKGDAMLQNTALAREPRLSVQPLTDAEYNRILGLAKGAADAAAAPSSDEIVRRDPVKAAPPPEAQAPAKGTSTPSVPAKPAKPAGAKPKSKPAAKKKAKVPVKKKKAGPKKPGARKKAPAKKKPVQKPGRKNAKRKRR